MWHVVLSGAGVPYQGKAPLFSANYQFYVRTLSHRAGQRGPAPTTSDPRPRPRAVACTFGCAILGLCVRAGVRSEHFQVEIGQIVLTSRHWKPV